MYLLFFFNLTMHLNWVRLFCTSIVFQIILRVAREGSINKIKLTVQKKNELARRFYEKAGFTVDESSPEGETYSYQILSRNLILTPPGLELSNAANQGLSTPGSMVHAFVPDTVATGRSLKVTVQGSGKLLTEGIH